MVPPISTDSPASDTAARYRAVRLQTERLCAPLCAEDYVVQSMPDCSPAKWHLAHTSWFFETFVLASARPGYRAFHPAYRTLFNSYYHSVGERHHRPERGLLSRPTVAEVYAYRRHVDEAMQDLLRLPGPGPAGLVELGLHHEQQHQELILTDIKHLFSRNPLRPAYLPEGPSPASTAGAARPHPAPAPPLRFVEFPERVRPIGHDGPGFAFDNEGPRHRVLVPAFALGSRLATCGEYLAFVEDGGYRRPELWLSDGWDLVQGLGLVAPLYWEREEGAWRHLTLHGMRPLDPAEPVCHLSYYETDAYARWSGARLPTEFEWEAAASEYESGTGNFLSSGRLHPAPAPEAAPGTASGAAVTQLFGDAWEWTASAYAPYPGYRPPAGALGEYNGKFMCSQLVLRGGSCVTPAGHVRATYRNFFPPAARWQFSGVRLARDVQA